MTGPEEEDAILKQLQTGVPSGTFQDDLHRRLSRALHDPSASSLDRGVLLRQLLRRWSLRDKRAVPVQLDRTYASAISPVASTVGLSALSGDMWMARPWNPRWLQLDGGIPDFASAAGSLAGFRFCPDPLRADPFFEAITGFDTYRTPGQRNACRAVMTVPEGSTVIGMLPTGSGKTEVALCLAERSRFSVTVIVVPTVALAYDFERRFREHYGRKNKRVKSEELVFAWTADTSPSDRDRLKHLVLQGQQPLLVTSPESLTRSLRQTLLDAASVGRLGGFVIDEAHLVTQWGRSFRPEFRTLADLRKDLLHASEKAGYGRAITLLLSATLGPAEMRDLTTLFGEPGPLTPIVANALRSEPDIWIAQADMEDQRVGWVLDALSHLPRPAVLYVTSPAKASDWLQRLRDHGYRRLAMVTGETKASDRAAVLQGIRGEPDAGRVVDLVVATSAFGLGIDYPHIRAIVHACLPETVDRWYQELGRGGRDGQACGAFLLTAPGDRKEAESLGVKVLSPDTARERWEDLWTHRRDVTGRVFVDLEGARGAVGKGDYNRRWNAQVIQGLIELGELAREQFDVEDLRDLLQTDDVEVSDWTAIRRIAAGMGAPDFWDRTWGEWQRSEMARSTTSLTAIRDVAAGTVGACSGIASAYAPSDELMREWGSQIQFMEPEGTCGRCPECRHRLLPVIEDPPPSPEQNWHVEPADLAALNQFVVAARGVNGLAFIALDVWKSDIISQLARGLKRLGVQHFSGLPKNESLGGEGVFFVDDGPLSPVDVSPMSSATFYRPNESVARRWLVRRSIKRLTLGGQELYDIVLLPQRTVIGAWAVGKDIPCIAAETALELLPRR